MIPDQCMQITRVTTQRAIPAPGRTNDRPPSSERAPPLAGIETAALIQVGNHSRPTGARYHLPVNVARYVAA
ncbi:MAG: hypothetical protein AMXMBFR82_06060 [Candidatus Hydrogenedentota bacterium]